MIECVNILSNVWDAFVDFIYSVFTHGRQRRERGDGFYYLWAHNERWGSQDYQRIEEAIRVAEALQEVYGPIYEFAVFRCYEQYGRPSAVITPVQYRESQARLQATAETLVLACGLAMHEASKVVPYASAVVPPPLSPFLLISKESR